MLNKMLEAALDLGATIVVKCDGEVDYRGQNLRDALDAIEAVDEALVICSDIDGQYRGTVLVVNGLDEDERCADASGWCDVWLDDASRD